MSEQLTQLDLQNLSDAIANSSIDIDRFATARGYANRKSARKAIRRASKKLPLPTPAPRRKATSGKSVAIPRKGTNSTIARNGGSGTRSNTTGRIKKGKEGTRGLAREGAGKSRVEGIGEDVAQGAGEGGGQRVDQGSDRFVQGRPFNEKIDRDFETFVRIVASFWVMVRPARRRMTRTKKASKIKYRDDGHQHDDEDYDEHD